MGNAISNFNASAKHSPKNCTTLDLVRGQFLPALYLSVLRSKVHVGTETETIRSNLLHNTLTGPESNFRYVSAPRIASEGSEVLYSRQPSVTRLTNFRRTHKWALFSSSPSHPDQDPTSFLLSNGSFITVDPTLATHMPAFSHILTNDTHLVIHLV